LWPDYWTDDGKLPPFVDGYLCSTLLYYESGADIMPTSVRLDTETETLLRRLARTSGRTKSDILREAVVRLAEEHSASSPADGPYALIADLVGIAQGGPRDVARGHKQAFRDVLSSKAQQ
jgi:hypothetical protein